MGLCFKHQTFIRFPLCALCYFRSYAGYRSEEAVRAFMTVFWYVFGDERAEHNTEFV